MVCYDAAGNIVSDQNSATHCSRNLACDKNAVDHFRIDWEDDYSLHNWMTKMDLICNEPYLIGFIGSISFISLSIGSIVFSKTIDQYGRKSVVMSTGITALFGLLILWLFADTGGLNLIYSVVFLTGSVYITRQSVCFLQAVELIESKDKMALSTIAFTFSGLLQMLTAFWFWRTKDQDGYFLGMIALLLLSVVLFGLLVPDSPVYLLEKEKYDEL